MLDWDDLRTFLAIARHHTLSGAARELGVRQSTMSRRLESLEGRAGVRLLQKTPSGFLLTEAGDAVLSHVERMEEEALAVEFAVTGRDERLDGLVRLATVGTVAATYLPPVLAEFHARYPDITVEVLTETHPLSLSRREADLSLWPERPTANELVSRKIRDFPYGVYASPEYLAQNGTPDLAAGAPGHSVILRNEGGMGSVEMHWFSELTYAARVAIRSISTDLHVAATEAGVGLGCLPLALVETRRVARIEVPGPAPSRQLWLAVHQDTRRTPRIRVLMDALTAGLKP